MSAVYSLEDLAERRPLPRFHDEEPPHTPILVDLEALGSDLSRNPLAEIATLVRALTYGEMIELVKQVWDKRPDEVLPLTEDNLPIVLHLWSTSHG